MIRATAFVLLSLLVATPVVADEKQFAQLSELAGKGDAQALFYVGLSYETGDGVKADPRKALESFEAAAKAGDPLAAYAVGRTYLKGSDELGIAKDKEKALGYFLQSAEAGYALAQSAAGMMLDAKKDPKGKELLDKAAMQGDPVALNKLGMKYRFGRGVPKDLAEAYTYFRKVAIVTGQMKNPQAVVYLLKTLRGLPEDAANRAEFHLKTWKPEPSEVTIRAEQGLKAVPALLAAK